MNFGLRLEEILSDLREDAISYGEGLHHGSVKSDDEIKIASESLLAIQTEAKQLITSLIKEMVAEAKPSKKHVGDEVAENRSYTGERLFNATIDEFEQNLLKALEEV